MPNRIIRESICTSESVNNLTAEEERFFYRLILQVDDYGRLDARPVVLRARCFPLLMDDIPLSAVDGWLQSLARAKLVKLYQVDSKPYLYFINWQKYQRVRAEKSKWPEPPSSDGGLLSTVSRLRTSEHNIDPSTNKGVYVKQKQPMEGVTAEQAKDFMSSQNGKHNIKDREGENNPHEQIDSKLRSSVSNSRTDAPVVVVEDVVENRNREAEAEAVPPIVPLNQGDAAAAQNKKTGDEKLETDADSVMTVAQVEDTGHIESTEQDPELTAMAICYESNCGMLTAAIAESLKELVGQYPGEYPGQWFGEAVREANVSSPRRPGLNYIKKILERWKVDGFRTKRRGIDYTDPVEDPETCDKKTCRGCRVEVCHLKYFRGRYAHMVQR